MITSKIKVLDTPEKLNNRAASLLNNLHQYTFGNLPAILDKIIKDKSWNKLPTKFNNFGEYTLNQSVDGLGVDSNEKLWLLKCAIDSNKKHIIEWHDVLTTVEKSIKAVPISERGKISGSLSLKTLANTPDLQKKITYYPAQASGQDKEILTLGKKHGNYLSKIAQEKLTRKQALIRTGLLKEHKISYNKAKSSFNLLDKEQKLEFIDWLKAEKYI